MNGVRKPGVMFKLMAIFAGIGALMAVAGVVSVQGMSQLRECLRIVYEDYTVAGTDLAHVSTGLLRFRNNVVVAQNAPDEASFRKILADQVSLEEKVTKSLDAYAATTLRVSKSGRNESRDLQTLRDALRQYFPAAKQTMKFLADAWSAVSKEKAEEAREKARMNAAINAVPKLQVAMQAIDELVETVRDVAKDMNENGVRSAERAMSILVGGTALAIVLGLLLGYLFARSMTKGLLLVRNAAIAGAAGDLTRRADCVSGDEIGEMAGAFNAMLDKITETVRRVRHGSEAVANASQEITSGNEDLAQRTSRQASALEETSASMEEMTSTIKQNADNATQANQLAGAARDIANKGGAVTAQAVDAMEEINKSSKKIADIITVIDEIAFQTNLLALNAAVEAARAGEHGRGFAVVAAEVRNLAQRSATAAKEIKGLINESTQRVTDGSELVNQSGKTLEEIVSSVKRVTDIIAEITAASQEQAQGIDQVNKAIMQMDETTQQNAALVEETTSASQSMKDQAQELMRQVEVFKVDTNGGHREANLRPATGKTAVKSGPTAPKPALKKPGFLSKPGDAKEPAGVAAGNGHDRRKKDDDFEEF